MKMTKDYKEKIVWNLQGELEGELNESIEVQIFNNSSHFRFNDVVELFLPSFRVHNIVTDTWHTCGTIENAKETILDTLKGKITKKELPVKLNELTVQEFTDLMEKVINKIRKQSSNTK